MRHPSPPFLRTLNTYVRFARVFRAANCCCAVSRAVLAAVSQDPRSACCRLSRPALCLLSSLKTFAGSQVCRSVLVSEALRCGDLTVLCRKQISQATLGKLHGIGLLRNLHGYVCPILKGGG
jgi:hypothetical protein